MTQMSRKVIHLPEDENLEVHVTVFRSPGMEAQLAKRESVRRALIEVFNVFPDLNQLTKFMKEISEGAGRIVSSSAEEVSDAQANDPSVAAGD